MGKYLVPFLGRNDSGHENQNFLWQENNIFIMDNHRAALWCWFQFINKNYQYSLFHIDQHYDTGPSIIEVSKDNCPDMFNIPLNDYLSQEYESEITKGYRPKTFRWDNYLTVFLENFRQNIKKVYFTTHHQGTLIDYQLIETKVSKLLNDLDSILSKNDNWIFNLDLDIMFGTIEDDEESIPQVIPDDFICELGKIIKKNLDEKRINVLTIALSPECCGGWNESERILNLLTAALGITFNLP